MHRPLYLAAARAQCQAWDGTLTPEQLEDKARGMADDPMLQLTVDAAMSARVEPANFARTSRSTPVRVIADRLIQIAQADGLRGLTDEERVNSVNLAVLLVHSLRQTGFEILPALKH